MIGHLRNTIEQARASRLTHDNCSASTRYASVGHDVGNAWIAARNGRSSSAVVNGLPNGDFPLWMARLSRAVRRCCAKPDGVARLLHRRGDAWERIAATLGHRPRFNTGWPCQITPVGGLATPRTRRSNAPTRFDPRLPVSDAERTASRQRLRGQASRHRLLFANSMAGQ